MWGGGFIERACSLYRRGASVTKSNGNEGLSPNDCKGEYTILKKVGTPNGGSVSEVLV